MTETNLPTLNDAQQILLLKKVYSTDRLSAPVKILMLCDVKFRYIYMPLLKREKYSKKLNDILMDMIELTDKANCLADMNHPMVRPLVDDFFNSKYHIGDGSMMVEDVKHRMHLSAKKLQKDIKAGKATKNGKESKRVHSNFLRYGKRLKNIAYYDRSKYSWFDSRFYIWKKPKNSLLIEHVSSSCLYKLAEKLSKDVEKDLEYYDGHGTPLESKCIRGLIENPTTLIAQRNALL